MPDLKDTLMLPTTMKTIEITEPGAPEVLSIGSRSLPEVADSEVLIKVAAAGVNGPDIAQRKGLYPPPKGASDLLGLEVSGEVVACGSTVLTLRVGDTVCALTNGGGYAEYVAVEASHCLTIPEGVDVMDAAGLPETFFTVWSNCFLNQTVAPGSLFLVHGGAGGIGSTAIQLGAALDLRVFTTCSSSDNADFCLNLGAERPINYLEEDFVEVVKEAGGANLIVDIVGGDYIGRNIKASNLDARIVQLAFNQGSTVEINLMPLMMKRLTLTGSTLRARSHKFKAEIATDLQEKMWPHFADGVLRTTTHSTFAMDQASEAHAFMEASSHRGKILLTM